MKQKWTGLFLELSLMYLENMKCVLLLVGVDIKMIHYHLGNFTMS